MYDDKDKIYKIINSNNEWFQEQIIISKNNELLPIHKVLDTPALVAAGKRKKIRSQVKKKREHANYIIFNITLTSF